MKKLRTCAEITQYDFERCIPHNFIKQLQQCFLKPLSISAIIEIAYKAQEIQ